MKAGFFLFFVLMITACAAAPNFSHNTTHSRNNDNPETNAENSPVNNLRITIANVGQGDAVLVKAPSGEAMLIDAGPPQAGMSKILPLLKSEGVSEIEAIVATHYHADHVGGIPEVIAGMDGMKGTDDDIIPKGGIYDRGEPTNIANDATYKFYAEATDGHRISAYPGDHIKLGDVDLEVVASGGVLKDKTRVLLGDPPDENAASIAIVINYAGFKMFLGGDITGGGGDPPYNTPDVETPLAPIVGNIDILKVSHHGSNTSTNLSFLAATKPKVAIISVGDRNDYYHPHKSVIERLIESGILVYQTERGWLSSDEPDVVNGNIVIEVKSDGSYEIQ